MFISHLTFFLSAIGFLLFIIKSYRQTNLERFLTLFSFLYFSLSGIWLFLNSYTKSEVYLLDIYGVLSENITLVTPVLIVYLFDKKVSNAILFRYLGIISLIGFAFFGIQYFIANDPENHLIFSHTNKNLIYNVLLQFVYDIILLISFLVGLKKINSNTTTELFDGTYKKVFSILFIVYYCQDILYFIMVVISINNIKPINSLYLISLLSNLLVAAMIITLAIYTNWLAIFNKLKSKFVEIENTFEEEPITPSIFNSENITSEIKSWTDFKKSMLSKHPEMIQKIENLEFLSKTEKLYAGLLPFDISHKEIADLLCVSLRTVETNFYRLRAKLKENNLSFSYPYNSVDNSNSTIN